MVAGSIVVLLLFLCTTYAADVSPLVNGVNQTIQPCESKYYSFDVSPPFTQFYFDFILASEQAVRVTILDKIPVLNGTFVCLTGYTATSCFTPQIGTLTPNCTIRASCALPRGKWYAVVENNGATNANFSLRYNVREYKASKDLRLNDKKDDPVRSEGNVIGANWTCDGCDPTDNRDYFKLTMPSVDRVGSRIVINVKPDNNTSPLIFTYLTYKQDVGCLGAPDGTQTEISPCRFNKTQGEVWYLTVQRTVSDQNYQVKAYVDRPRVETLEAGQANTKADRLLEAFDVVYFQMKFPATEPASAQHRMIFVLDNVDNGNLELSADYSFLPGQGCGTTYKSCTSTSGCILRYDPCETDGRKTGTWFLGVRALSFVNKNLPITFTISAEVQRMNQVPVSYNVPVKMRTKLGITDQFILPLPPTPSSWVRIHVYVDASSFRQVVNSTAAVLYINNKPLAGAFGCYAYTRQCRLELSRIDVMSCSVQLDPCELSSYSSNGGVTMSLWATKSDNLFWFQENLLYTMDLTYFDPLRDAKRQLRSGTVLNGAVTAGEYQLYRVSSVSGRFLLKVDHDTPPTVVQPILSKRDVAIQQQQQQQQINILIFQSASNLGPNCPCWIPNYQYNLTIGQSAEHSLDYCSTLGLDSGLIVAIQGVPLLPPANTFLYEELYYTMSLEISQQSDPNTITDLGVGPEAVVSADARFPKYYRLQFPRGGLTSKALVIKTRAHSNAAVLTSLKLFNTSNPLIGCQQFNEPTSFTCTTANTDVDGYCTITKKGCFFSDNDNRVFIVEVKSTSNAFTAAVYNIHFELVDQSPRALTSGSPISNVLERDLYHHYFIDVPSSFAGTRSLIVEVYIDSGLQNSRIAPLKLFMNDPTTPSPAGDTDCLCFTPPGINATYTKSVVVINACDLKTGRYHFGLTTAAKVYDALPTQYTMWATFIDPLIKADFTPTGIIPPFTNQVPFTFDLPYDMSLFVGQRTTIQFTIPSSFVTDPTDTRKDISIKITTTRSTDVVQASLSQVSPLSCGCYTPDDTCTAFGGTCNIPLRYCTSGSGVRYLEVSVTQSLDTKNPVPFTVFIQRDTPHKTVLPLTVVTGCSIDARTPFILSGLTENQYYQHFKLNYQGTPVGEEILQFYFQNVTDGQVIGNLARGNLATRYCPDPALNLVCNENPSGDCPPKSAECITNSDYFSVFANSANNNNPVSYKLSACRTTIQDYTAAGISAARLAVGDSLTYRVSLAAINDADTPLTVITISSPSASPLGLSLVFKQSRCKACPSSVEWTRTIQSCTTSSCKLIVQYCELPGNFKVTDFFVTVTSALATEQTFDLKVMQTKPDSAQTLTTNQKTTISVPANDGWSLLSWTLSPNDIVAPEKGVQRALMLFTSKDTAGAAVTSYYSVSRSASMCASQVVATRNTHIQDQVNSQSVGTACCTQSGSYFLAFYNPSNTAASFEITPILDLETDILADFAWDDSSSSATGTITAKQHIPSRINNTLPQLLTDGVIRFPGLRANSFGWTVLLVTQTAASDSISNVFVERNRVAGPSAQSVCYGQSVFPGTGNVGSTNFSSPLTIQFYECSIIRSDFWFGVRTLDETKTVPFSVSMNNYYPKSLPFNTSQVFTVSSNPSVTSNFVVDISENAIGSRRNIRILVETTVDGDTVQVFVNQGNLAGTGAPCVGVLAGIPSGVAGFGAARYDSGAISSCVVNIGKLFVGIRPRSPLNTPDATSVSVNISVIGESTPDANTSTTLVLNLPISGQTYTGTPVIYSYRSVTSFPANKINYFITEFSDLTSNVLAAPQFTWTRAGRCSTPFNTMYCNPSTAAPDTNPDTKCSSIIFPCNTVADTTYEFTLNNLVNQSDVWTIGMKEVSVDVQQITTTGQYQLELNAHELKFVRVSLVSSFFEPGQNISISISGVSCGTVGAWINQDIVPGPNCFAANSGNCDSVSTSCSLYNTQTCDTLSRDITGDYWITLRGLSQFSKTIPIKVQISVDATPTFVFKSLHVNERHTFLALPLNRTASTTCTDIQRTTVPLPTCCTPTANFAAQVWQHTPTVWVYPIEGAHFFENFNSITLSLQNDRVSSAEIVITTQRPDFCTASPASANVISDRCVADGTNGFQCTMAIRQCTYRDVRQIYVYIRSLQYFSSGTRRLITDLNNTLTTTGPINGATSIPLLYITNTRQPYTVVDVSPSRAPQYVRFRLVPDEVQMFRIVHDPARSTSSAIDYYTRVSVIRVQGGRVEFTKTWDRCTSSQPVTCTELVSCKEKVLGACATNNLPSCTCQPFTYQGCNTDINVNGFSFFHIRPASLESAANATVWGILRFEFYVDRFPINPDICDVVDVNAHKYFSHNFQPLPDQIYKFDLRQQSSSGTVTLNIAENILPVTGQCSMNGGQTCPSTSRTLCTTLYRRAGTPQLSVYGTAVSVSKQYFNFDAKVITVPIKTLSNAQSWTTPISSVNATTKCVEFNRTEYYKFSANSSADAILVEYQGTGTLYMNKGHVTYQWGTQTCTAAGGYCNFLVACDQNGDQPGNGLPGDYYFHAPAASHTVTVTQLKVAPTPLTVGAPTPATRTLKARGDYFVYSITNFGGQHLDPTNDLYITYNTIPGVSVWVTRGKIGDQSCPISTSALPNAQGVKIPACQIHASTESFFVHFLVTGSAGCSETTLSIRTYLAVDNTTKIFRTVDPNQNISIAPAETVRMKFNVGKLGAEDVVKVRIPNVQFGTVTHNVWKSNYVSTAPQKAPCGSSCALNAAHPLASWGDNCWHCGDDNYDTVFVDVTGGATVAQYEKSQFWVTAEKKQWVDLSNGQPVSATLADPSLDLAFFSAPFLPQGNLIEVFVTDGFGVEVQILAADCSLRVAPPVTMWCFEGQECHVPFSVQGNFGSFEPTLKPSFISNLWADKKLRIVISGRNATFRVRDMSGGNACSGIRGSDTAFCAGSVSGAAFGTVTTFPTKDSYASQFYSVLERSFSCARESGCACKTLTQTCKNLLRQYACEGAFRPCQGSGLARYQTLSLCSSIEVECGRSWEGAGLAQFHCAHNFYADSNPFVSGNSDDDGGGSVTSPPSGPVDLTWLWVLLGIIGAIIVIAVIVCAARAVGPRALTPELLVGGSDDVEMKRDNPYVILNNN